MNYFKQLLYEMRHHRMMTWVSISGTALAIFLVMSFMMSDNISTSDIAPETRRDRIMTGKNMHAEGLNNNGGGSTSGLNAEFAQRIYGDLPGVEQISYVSAWDSSTDVNVKGEESISSPTRSVDENFWKIYEFTFVDGRPFDEAERKAEPNLAVISASTARMLFGEERVAGREIEINMTPYTVIGVVRDVSPVLGNSFAMIYLIFNPDNQNNDHPVFGNTNVRLLLKEGKDPEEVKQDVKARYGRLHPEIEKEGYDLIYHEQPYTAEDDMAGTGGSNNSPQTKQQKMLHLFIYAILLLLPAINLSSMTRSRLRHRVAEIGVRRAFGARRKDILLQLFGENMLISIIGGAIGLFLSFIFLLFASTFLFSYVNGFDMSLELHNTRPDLGMIFRWNNFLVAFLLCFVLNILSATVPAWKASLTEPAEALSSR